MSMPWQMIPRYHPQISHWDITSSLLRKPAAGLHSLASGRTVAREGENLFALNSATTGLVVALKALNLPAGAGVAVPIYNCVTVFEAVRLAGLRCVFIDIDPATFGFDLDDLARRRGEVSAAILVHTFGYPGDFDVVSGILPGRPMIEDCSHALGSRYDGGQVGFRGAASVFSFNFQKPISVGGGGWLVVNDPALLGSVSRQVEAMGEEPSTPGGGALLRRILKAALYRRPWYGLLLSSHLLRADREGILRDIQIGRMSRLDRALIDRSLPSLDDRCRKLRAWTAELCELTRPLPPACNYLAIGDRWNGYLWPVTVESPARRQELAAFFRSRGVDAFLLWLECLQMAQQYGYRPGDCPRVEDVLPRLIMLPCYPELATPQRQKILKVVQESDLSAKK